MSSTVVERGVRLTPSGTFEAVVVHNGLPNGRITRNFAAREDASRYRATLLAQLDAGVVPKDAAQDSINQVSIGKMLEEYLASAPVAKSDRPLVTMLSKNNTRTRVCDITPQWADAWVKAMKDERLKPGSIRKRMESMARGLEWWHRTKHPQTVFANPLRSMPRGYSAYRQGDLKEGEKPVIDESRDRRLAAGEEEKIIKAIHGWRNPDRQRPLPTNDAIHMQAMFRLIINTGLRLREAYRLRLRDIDINARVIMVTRSKTGTARMVPLNRAATEELKSYLKARSNLQPESPLFPWWMGSDDDAHLAMISSRLSRRFRSLFDYVGSTDLTEHDLRHEAVCRWMMMRDKSGQWLYRPEEVRRITGHKNAAVFERYLSLRGEDLVRD